MLKSAALIAFSLIPQLSIAPPPKAEPITVTHVSHADRGGVLRINAFTGGCTSAKDFDVTIRRRDGVQHITIVRTTPDHCELFAPNGTNLTIAVPSLDTDAPIVVENPLFVPYRAK